MLHYKRQRVYQEIHPLSFIILYNSLPRCLAASLPFVRLVACFHNFKTLPVQLPLEVEGGSGFGDIADRS